MSASPPSDASAPRPLPVRIEPPSGPLPTARLLRTVIRNPIEIWPRAVYEEPVYRRRLLARDTLFLMDPDLIRDALVDGADRLGKSDAMRRSLGPALGQGLLTADGPAWRWQRRAAAPIFRPDRVDAFVPAMIAAARRTRDRLAASAGGTVEIGHEMMRTTFDIIVETMLSGRAGIDVDRVERSITEYLESTSWTLALALLRAPRWTPYPGQRRSGRARRYLRGEITRIAAERRRSGERPPDLISLLLDAVDAETGRQMGDETLTDNLLTFVTAGHETTALALTWTLYLLDLHPEIAARVRAEVEAATGGAELDAESVGRLAYARQVCQEAMRLYPPAPFLVREAEQDLAVGGETIQAGTNLVVPIYAIHRHVRLWDEPDRFDPERFRPEAVKARHRFAYLPFGAGPRICIGMGFALTEAVAILATLLRDLNFSRDRSVSPDLRVRVTLRPGQGMPMQVSRRSRR